MLESLSESCLESARDKNAEIRFDEHAKAPAALRTYNMDTAAAVRDLYREMRTKQTLEHVKRLREKYGKLELEMTVWEASARRLSACRTRALPPTRPCPSLPRVLPDAQSIRWVGSSTSLIQT